MKKFLIVILLISAPLMAQVKPDPDFNTIMFCPTPQTLPAGSQYFKDFELFFLNYGFSLSDNTTISIGTHFPVTGGLAFVTAGFKQRIFNRDTHPLGLAVFANGTFYDDGSFGMIGLIAGIGDNDSSLNLALSQGYKEHANSEIFVMVGADRRVGGGTKLIAEYLNAHEFLDLYDDEFYGFGNFGIKWFGETMAVSLTGLMPLSSSTLFAFPMVSISKHW
jgi:hypothetical protein